MSEYQYYEFQAIDKPLDDRAMDELRKMTSRAEITRYRLFNEYQWGNFKGNPLRLMEDYFDGHMYYANWGSRRLMLRLPKVAFDLAGARPYFLDPILECHHFEEYAILDFQIHRDDLDTRDFHGFLDSLIELRNDLMAGDFRCLYLGWLGGLFDINGIDEDAIEPPIPPGMKKLNKRLLDFVHFFGVDADLLKIAEKDTAVLDSPPAIDPGVWIAQLPVADKDRYLLQLLQGEGASPKGELLHRFHKESIPRTGAGQSKSTGRTAGDLLKRWEVVSQEERLKAEAKAAKAKEAE